MRDICAIKALATRDEKLGGDHLFGRQDLASEAENFVLLTTVDPILLDGQCGIANTGDEVYEVVAATRLGKPDWILNVGLEALLHQHFKGTRNSVGRRHKIEILGGAPDTRVMVKGKSAADCEWNIGLKESANDSLVAGVSIGRPRGLL